MHFTKYDLGGSASVIFGIMHYLVISENVFFHEIKCDGMTSFIDFMKYGLASSWQGWQRQGECIELYRNESPYQAGVTYTATE